MPAAGAQEYRSDPVDEKARAEGARYKTWLTNPAAYTAGKANFNEYFQKYYFPDMTRNGPDDLARLGDSRYNLFKRYLWATNNEELQRDLTNMAFPVMRRIVQSKPPDPPYHPAVRYNAVLILGMLDKQYAVNDRRPTPLPESNAFLTQIISWAAEDKPVPTPVALGALIGLERHAQFRENLPPEAVDAMTTALLKLATHEKPIQEMDSDAYAWLRLRAASALAQLGSVGPNNAVHDALLKLIADFKSLDDRCASAALLTKLKFEGAKVDGAATVEPLLKLARDLAAAEAKRAQDFENGIAGGVVGPGRASFGTAEPQLFPRRHVLARLTELRSGLLHVKPLATDEGKKKIDAVVKAIDPVRAAAINKDTVELRLTETIRLMAAAIDDATTPTEEPAAEADALQAAAAEK